MNPPIVYVDSIPRSHNTINIIAMMYNMIIIFDEKIVL